MSDYIYKFYVKNRLKHLVKMPNIINEVKLDFKDVLLRPKRSTLKSRNDVSLFLINVSNTEISKVWKHVTLCEYCNGILELRYSSVGIYITIAIFILSIWYSFLIFRDSITVFSRNF